MRTQSGGGVLEFWVLSHSLYCYVVVFFYFDSDFDFCILLFIRVANGTSMQQSKMEGNKEMGLIGENFDSGLMGGARDDEYESRSGSDNFDVASGDDQDAGDDQPPQKKKKKYHRHTPQQIHELET